jgi:mitogen-activated protein kinase kinase kinase 5
VDGAESEFNPPFRRSSTGVLLSPEVDVSSTSKITPGEMSESDGIWILKKDSQRRQTLFKVLSEDEKKICDTWMEKIENERSEKTFLEMVKKNYFIFVKINQIKNFQSHLETLIRALRDFINDQKKESLKNTLCQLKKELLEFNAKAIDHLNYALLKFQDAVAAVLRCVSIKPHWIFALDTLIRSAIQSSIMILSPG